LGCLHVLAKSSSSLAAVNEHSGIAAVNCVWPPATTTSAFDWCGMSVIESVRKLGMSVANADAALQLCPRTPEGPYMVLERTRDELRAEFMRAIDMTASATGSGKTRP